MLASGVVCVGLPKNLPIKTSGVQLWDQMFILSHLNKNTNFTKSYLIQNVLIIHLTVGYCKISVLKQNHSRKKYSIIYINEKYILLNYNVNEKNTLNMIMLILLFENSYNIRHCFFIIVFCGLSN